MRYLFTHGDLATPSRSGQYLPTAHTCLRQSERGRAHLLWNRLRYQPLLFGETRQRGQTQAFDDTTAVDDRPEDDETLEDVELAQL